MKKIHALFIAILLGTILSSQTNFSYWTDIWQSTKQKISSTISPLIEHMPPGWIPANLIAAALLSAGIEYYNKKPSLQNIIGISLAMGAIYKILQYYNPTPPTEPLNKNPEEESKENIQPTRRPMEKYDPNDLDPNEVEKILAPYTNREIKREQIIKSHLPTYRPVFRSTFRPTFRPIYREPRAPLNGPREQPRGKF